MVRVIGCIRDEHDIRLVGLAVVICLFACYTAFSLLSRAGSGAGRSRLGWLAAAAFVTGSGVWSTHFVAMLAFRPGLPNGYDVTLTALSVAIAVVFAASGFVIGDRPGPQAALGGAVVGAGIGAMHFTGMKALFVPAVKHWDPTYAHAALAIGIVGASLALWVGQRRRDMRGRVTAASLLAFGICGLHFTAMAAFSLEPDPRVVMSGAAIAPEWLAALVAALTLMIVTLGFAGSAIDEHLASRAAAEAGRLRAHVAALEGTQAQLEETTRQLQDALAAAAAGSQAKSQFLAMMSHELRTPLNAIIGFSEIAVKEMFGPLSQRYRDYAKSVADSGTHLLGLINDVLDFSKIEAGHFDLDEQPVDVAAIVGEATHMLESQAAAASVRLGTELADALPPVMADPRRLRQILLNLLSNAVKFTGAGGEVQVSAWSDESGLWIAVSDTGIGMAEQDIPNALERFVQIDSDLNRKHGGTGLGLPLSKRLVELHDGTLEIKSTLGVGTTVTVRLPRRRILDPMIGDVLTATSPAAP